MGIAVLPPSVNESYGNFTVIDDSNIRFGMVLHQKFGMGVGDSIIAARKTGGPFTDIANFLSRIPTPLEAAPLTEVGQKHQ